ncbi:MAG TPA: Rieske (2Fe-2S) protein [Propionicimonas sp.]|nr:Rieske (2Fe-2S) protein [Propionicimonas sp.]HRA06127.1 Rieske (2Fe-2S) protein [Propionicimonas sp.]
MNTPLPSRRAALITIGGTTLAVCLAGCAPAASGGTSNGAASGGNTLAVADVPVGGGKIVGEYVVTQPSEGKFEAFSYLCTHQNLPVQDVTDAAIVCGRHGSTFSLADGSVLTGPATTALAKAKVTVSGDSLTIS